MKKIQKYCFLVLAVLIFSCSAEKESQKDETPKIKPMFENSINVNLSKVLAWINMMPNSETRFNITGEMTLLKTEDIRLKEIELSEIKIYQKGKMVYRINPTIRWNDEDLTSRSLSFSTLKGLSLIPTFDDNKSIDALFEFDYNSEKLIYFVQSIPIEKAH